MEPFTIIPPESTKTPAPTAPTDNPISAWLADPSLFDVPYGKYLLLAVIVGFSLLLLYQGTRRLLRIIKLHLLAWFTSRADSTRIISHVDGDTIRIPAKNGDKPTVSVRMIGVDTPESRRSLYMNIAPFGKEAAAYTKKRLRIGKRVILVYDKEKTDKFGRQLAYVYLPNGEFFNATLIARGYGWAAHYRPNTKYANYFDKLQHKAKRRRRQLWRIYDERGVLNPKYRE